MSSNEKWISEVLPLHDRVKDAVMTIVDSLLRANKVDYLSVTGRTKTAEGILEKIKRKDYKDPATQVTDIAGVGVIVFLESDVQRVSDLVEGSFEVDKKNSLNQDDRLSTNQIGYRSVHYVCSLGESRGCLPEFSGLSNIKCEIQIRTVLQHAWAELAHDRNYKFSGNLPAQIERKLFLYAGMLEIADKGFDDLAKSIDSYSKQVVERTAKGDYDYDLDSISLPEFVEAWAEDNGLGVRSLSGWRKDYGELLSELRQFGITKASELAKIIPSEYSNVAKKENYSTTVFGYVRDWMLIHDWRKYLDKVDFQWLMSGRHIYDHFFDATELGEFTKSFEWAPDEPPDEEEYEGEPFEK